MAKQVTKGIRCPARKSHGFNRSVCTAAVLSFALVAAVLSVTVPPASAIFEGRKANLGDYPYQVSLEDEVGQFCGGSLVGAAVVLSAAHCLDESISSRVQIRAGAVDLRKGGQVRDVQRIDIHPEWGSVGLANDVAVLYLDRPFDLNENVQTIDAVSSQVDRQSRPGAEVIVSGWGEINTERATPVQRLRATDVRLVSDTQCLRRLSEEGRESFDPDTMVCADGGPSMSGKGSCTGDSGGPLARQNSDRAWVQVGIVSWGVSCGNQPVEGVYTDLESLRGWVAERIADAPTPESERPEIPPAGEVAETQFRVDGPFKIPARGGAGVASEWPSILGVSGVPGEVAAIEVTMRGLKHQRAQDVAVALVSPEGTEVVLMAWAGRRTQTLERSTFTFSESARRRIPRAFSTLAGVYRPTDRTPIFFNEPELEGRDDLTAFNGENPNGEWQLYLKDQLPRRIGSLGGWELNIVTK